MTGGGHSFSAGPLWGGGATAAQQTGGGGEAYRRNSPGLRPAGAVEERLHDSGACLAAAVCRPGTQGWGGGGGHHGQRAASGKGLENKRKGETPPNTRGIETSQSPRLVGIQHHGGPQKAKGAAWGGATGQSPSPCRPALLPSSRPAAQSRSGCSSAGPGEVLVASKHLNIA